ncbi:hypothetical protein IFM89_022352 [Coptis chinensis]|uniref:SWIM-type domain-containing protein n=1 Tax=Coptis chinensis TaxID=261450 RepID=A0A835LEA2_9MAGN|nr:hypothetical protein IFM89_022352 [Coptis chinensis]
MYQNFKKTFRGELWDNLAWGAAEAYKVQEFTRILGVINKTDSKALDWLDREPRSCWARAHFDWTAKCDQLTNNFSESFNSWILHIRDKPHSAFIDQYNLDLLNLMYTRRELSMELLEGDIVPNVLFMIKKREMRYNWYEVRVVSDIEYLVVNTKKGSRYSVDLVKLECTCIEWQLSGVPCVYGIVVIRQRRGDKWARYCSPYFSVEAFRQTYSNYVYPLDNIEEWPEIEDP